MTKILVGWPLAWLLIGLNIVLLGVLLLPCQRTVTDSLRKLVGVAVFVFMLGANNGQAVNGPSGADFAQGHRPGNGEVWRDVEHGGFNAVYFLLKVCGDVQDYEEALTKMQGLRLPETLAEVLATGRQLGTPLQARFLTPDQLDNHPLPVIVHVEGDNLSEGCFYVLLQNQGQLLVFLDGPSGTICTIDRESFLRRWSGVAVSPRSRSWWIAASQVMFWGCSWGISCPALAQEKSMLMSSRHLTSNRADCQAANTNKFGQSPHREVLMRNKVYPPLGVLASLITMSGIAIAVLVQAEGTGKGQEASSLKLPAEHGGTSFPKTCKEVLASNVQALRTFGIGYSLHRTYAVEGLPRIKDDEGYFYWDAGKFYWRSVLTFPVLQGRKDRPTAEEKMSFDGSVFYRGTRHSSVQALLQKFLGDNPDDPNAKNTLISLSYLDAVGFSLPETAAQLLHKSSLESSVLLFTSTGKVMQMTTEGSTLVLSVRIPEPYVAIAKQLDLDSLKDGTNDGIIAEYRRLRQLDWYRQVDLWLDLEKGCAIKRRKDCNPDGKLIQTIDCEDFRYTRKANLWLPWKCIVKNYLTAPRFLKRFTDEPQQTDCIGVQEVTFEPRADISFTLDYGSGTFVTDYSRKESIGAPLGNVTYTVPADKNELRAAAMDARKTRSTQVRLLVATGLLAVVLICLVLRRKARRKAGREHG